MDEPDRLSRSRALSGFSDGRNNHEWAPLYSGQQNAIPHYQTSTGLSYLTNGHQLQFSPVTAAYPQYSTNYLTNSNNSQAAIYMPGSSSAPMAYAVRPPAPGVTLPSQQRVLARNSYYSSSASARHAQQLQLRSSHPMDLVMMDTEEQDSVNRETMRSEPVEPPVHGYPDVGEFEKLMKEYVDQLSPKKQDKALIHASRAANIRRVLIDKKTTAVESAQFRFWVKKMFQLHPSDPSISMDRRKICHEGKPVAIREKLFKILTRAHQKCQHGGRDKTSYQVRQVYSWVPKELISRFVKLCPTCRMRRGMNRDEGGEDSEKSPPDYDDLEGAGDTQSPVRTGRKSTNEDQDTNMTDLPTQLMNGTSTFQSQNRWLSDYHPPHSAYHNIYDATVSNGSASSFTSMTNSSGFEEQANPPLEPKHLHRLPTRGNGSPLQSRSGLHQLSRQNQQPNHYYK